MAIFAILLLFGSSSRAEDRPHRPPMMREHQQHGPYGGYCRGPRWGWYGARTPVHTQDEARKHLEKFFEGQEVEIGPITEGGRFFRADILDKDKNVVDRVIIDRRTGRIRSLY